MRAKHVAKAKRFNKGKPKLSYVLDFPTAVRSMAAVMEKGEIKYGDRYNWRKGLPVSELVDSLLRHALAIQNGETTDPESGELHAGHLMCNAAMLAEVVTKKTP